ncbi:MAG: tetratricopeptide repeat protein [Desulfovibrionaceae bacterium]
MKHLSHLRHLLFAVTTLSCFSLLGCGGCASHDSNNEKKSQNAVIWELSPEAQGTFAYLLYDQALRQEDEQVLLRALEALKTHTPPPAVYIESSIWLMSRKSPLAPTAIEIGLSLFPADTSLSLLYAESMMENGKKDEAIDYMRKFSTAHPENVNARLELALLLVKGLQFAEAQKILSAISGKERTALVDYYHARALIGMNRAVEAVPYLQKAVKASPEFIEAMAELAYIYERGKQYNAARKVYEKMLKLNDESQEVLMRLIALSLRLDQPAKALEFAHKGPQDPAFALTVASMFMEARKYAQAETQLRVIAQNPNAPSEVFFYLAAAAYEGRQDVREALNFLDKIPKNNTYFDRAVLLRVQLLAQEGKLDEALKAAQQGQISSPEQTELWQIEIRLLASLKKSAEALKAADKAVTVWPDNGDLAFLRASLLDEQGNKKAALAAMEAIITRHPDHAQALNYVGYTLAEKGQDLPRAVSLLEQAMRLSPTMSYIVDSLAWAQFKAGKTAQAWETINKAVSMDGEPDPTIWEHYGDIAKALGNTVEFRKGYEKALEFNPPNAESLRKKLAK